MQTQVIQSTQQSLPTTQLQIPTNQSEEAENKITKYRKKTVRNFGVSSKK